MKIICLLLIMLCTKTTLLAESSTPGNLPETCYLFSYFVDNGQDGLHLAWSSDGLNWAALKQGESLLHPKVGPEKIMRDPCIAQGPDGTFHMVWTDSWKSQTIGYASSKNLINWSEQKDLAVMKDEPGVNNCWAPELVYDAGQKGFIIYWASTIPGRFPETEFGGKNDHNHRIYATTTRDFETFTPAKLFFDPGFNCIDSSILSLRGKFYMFFKDENLVPVPMKNLRIAVADHVSGPYRVEAAPINPPGSWVEGPSALQVGDTTYLYFDAYKKQHYGALRSRDLKTWEDVTAQLDLPKGTKHGTAFPVKAEILKRLLAEDNEPAAEMPGHAPHSANPILPGYYADPSILEHAGKSYIYATLDPWGGQTLGCWESSDFKHWTYRVLNWPTKQACTSRTSKSDMVWAPSVVRGADGKFYMYVSVGNEVWAGTADQPLGPWRNLLGDRPLIPENFKPGFHMIDAEAFLDDDGQAYLYWGSGHNWTNGRCWAVRLKPDMTTFDGEVKDVTPAHYFEAPFMVKHGGRYFLMNSTGKTTEDSYQVRYAVGDNPFGPFTEPANSLILATDKTNNVISPGHHAVFAKDGRHYILYHRQSVPFDRGFMGRQVCVDELKFTPDGLIETIVPTHAGPALVQGRAAKRPSLAVGATASSQSGKFTGPKRVLDDNYATRWAAAKDAKGAWLQLDLGGAKSIMRQEIRPEYAWKPYRLFVQSSNDGRQWQTQADFTRTPSSGSPIIVEKPISARYLRLVFPEDIKGADISLFEWNVY